MPQAIFSSPQVATVGLTEREARVRGRPYLVSEYRYDHAAYGASIEDHDGFVRVLADEETREILGCHISGTDATVLIQEAVIATRMHARVGAITGAIYAHSALPEVVQRAFGSLHEPDEPPAGGGAPAARVTRTRRISARALRQNRCPQVTWLLATAPTAARARIACTARQRDSKE